MNQVVNEGKVIVAGGTGVAVGLLLPHLLGPAIVLGVLASGSYAVYQGYKHLTKPARRY